MWDERYGSGEYVYGREPNEFLVAKARMIPRGRVLSLADGQGRNGVYLAGLGYAVTAVDSSAVGLQMARELAVERGVPLTTIVADLADYAPGEACWEGIVSIFCHLPSALRRSVLAKMVRALVPGGVLLLEAYTPAQLQFDTGGPRDADLLASLADLREDLSGLTLVHAFEGERSVIEGTLHRGRAAVVQVVAVKPNPDPDAGLLGEGVDRGA
ncbi:MAG: SAM-dependent methyltransferase [Blastocatellia bacterium]